MDDNTKKLDIVKKYFLRKEDGTIDYEHPYDYIGEKKYSGLHRVELNGHVGYMNSEGKFIIPIEYDCNRVNYKGMTLCNASSWQYFDEETYVIEVYKDNCVGVINNRGEKIVPCEFEDVEIFSFKASPDFIPIALKSNGNKSLVWGLYDVKKKRISVTPQYEQIEREWNGYASFKQNDKWGLLHCATGTVVAPAIYLLDFNVNENCIARAFLGGKWEYFGNGRSVEPNECHVLVVNGIDKAQVVLSGYDWIETSGPNVVNCRTGNRFNPTQEDSFKIIKMPDYIAMIKNAFYEEGYILKTTGEFVSKWTVDCTTYEKLKHAKYISGGIMFVKTYDGRDIPVTSVIIQEIQNYISKE